MKFNAIKGHQGIETRVKDTAYVEAVPAFDYAKQGIRINAVLLTDCD